jgi:hypothetical protein
MMSNEDENIKIRLGPVVYHTQRNVLLSAGGMLAAMFSSAMLIEPSTVDEDGAYQIQDRDPYLFGYILRFLECAGEQSTITTTTMDSPSSSSTRTLVDFLPIVNELSPGGLEMLLVEVDFFQIAKLQEAVQAEIDSRREAQKDLRNKIRNNVRGVSFLKMRKLEKELEIRATRRLKMM